MKALTYHGFHDICFEAMADPAPQSERDAIVQVNACSMRVRLARSRWF